MLRREGTLPAFYPSACPSFPHPFLGVTHLGIVISCCMDADGTGGKLCHIDASPDLLASLSTAWASPVQGTAAKSCCRRGQLRSMANRPGPGLLPRLDAACLSAYGPRRASSSPASAGALCPVVRMYRHRAARPLGTSLLPTSWQSLFPDLAALYLTSGNRLLTAASVSEGVELKRSCDFGDVSCTVLTRASKSGTYCLFMRIPAPLHG